MSDESAVPIEQAAAPGTTGSFGNEPTVAFCQQCGRALSPSTRRQLGSATFCEPCATLAATGAGSGAGGWRPVNAGPPPAYTAAPTSAAPGGDPRFGPRRAGFGGEPNPVLAGFLGLIPGVGAMFNGQYPKGAIHLIVFVVLVSLADNLNWVFWWFVWGWIFYQAFDAYHTSLARRDGQPLPDPFGWNELGERMGAGRSWPPATHVPSPQTATMGYRPAPPPYAQPSVEGPLPPEATHAAFVADSGSYPASEVAPSSSAPPYGSAPFTPVPPNPPYSATYTGGGSASVMPSPITSRRFPMGAAWLIGLGVLFLLGNLLPSWQLQGRWLVPILLGALALWLAVQRVLNLRVTLPMLDGERVKPSINRVAGALLGPALLATVAVLLGLQAGDVVPLRHSWPALLIVWGALQLLERAPAMAANSVNASPETASPRSSGGSERAGGS